MNKRSLGIGLHVSLLTVFAGAIFWYEIVALTLNIGSSALRDALSGVFFLVFVPLFVLGICFLFLIPAPYKFLPWIGMAILPTSMVWPVPNLSQLLFIGIAHLSEQLGLHSINRGENAFQIGAFIAACLSCTTVWQYVRLYRTGITRATE